MEDPVSTEESNISAPESQDSAAAAPISSRRETVNRNVYIMLDVNHRKVNYLFS